MKVSAANDFAFIARETVTRTDGKTDNKLLGVRGDLFLHIKEKGERHGLG
jgi:hypothetical protein